LEPNNYEVLLVAAGLASYTLFGFAIKPTAWRKFFGRHWFAVHNRAIKFEQKKIDLNAYINNGAHLNKIKGSSTLCELGIKPSNLPTKLRSR
jgi:hypothetical protein